MDIHNKEFQLRATGRTTRIIDETIQDLYLNYKKWIEICDHYYENREQNKRNTEIIADKILRRMSLEHPSDVVEKKYENGAYFLKLAKCGPIDFKREEMKKLENENFKKHAYEQINIFR